MFKYFTFGDDESIDSLKKQYWKLARQYHPDFNGNTEQANNIMKEINNEYEKALQNLGKIKNKNYRVDEDYIIIVNETLKLNMENVDIEVCGWFVYLWGETKPHKEELKKLGYRWNGKKVCWYWRPSWYTKRNRNSWSMDKIRETWGSEKVEQEKKRREEKKKIA